MTQAWVQNRAGHAGWKESHYLGEAVDFFPVEREDDFLHPVGPNAHFTAIETNLYGFNIPEAQIQCNIYVLWHHVLKTMSVHIFVTKGDRIFRHQLEADYFMEHQYLPGVTDNADWSLTMGSCAVRMKIVEPLKEILIQFRDQSRGFDLDYTMSAAMPPVGRPGGKHFTQLMKTNGSLTLDGQDYAIDGFYVRDRSWGYNRPEQPERTPPYRWMTGWAGAGTGFVVAWMDTGMLDGPEFGPEWNSVVAGDDAKGINKWESGGPTPSLNLRSGWIAIAGRPIPVVAMTARTRFAEGSRLLVEAIEIDIDDAEGGRHRVEATTRSMYPKLYWQNIVTYMHCVGLTIDGRVGHGDLMDSYTTHHVRKFGL